MNDRVFIASTVYDLLDIRAELEQTVRDSGLLPVLSESITSHFEVIPDANSIETCLVNLRSADHVIFILSQRYGSSLQAAGYDDISATHLEYLEATKSKKNIYLYVRDRLESDYRLWRKNGNNYGLKYAWVHDKDTKIFDMIHSHQELVLNNPKKNWYQVFQTSVDLKKLIMRDLRLTAAKASLSKSIANNTVPLFQGTTSVESNGSLYFLKCTFINNGRTPAFNVTTEWKNDTNENKDSYVAPIVAPLNELSRNIITRPTTGGMIKYDDKIKLIYFTADGHKIVDTFTAKLHSTQNIFISPVFVHSLKHDSRRYIAGSAIPFTIEDDID